MLSLDGFVCTDEEINDVTDAAAADYKAFGDELQADARALLATVRHLLTGREIAAVEAAADIENSEGVDVYLLAALKTRFSREIAQWKDGVAA